MCTGSKHNQQTSTQAKSSQQTTTKNPTVVSSVQSSTKPVRDSKGRFAPKAQKQTTPQAATTNYPKDIFGNQIVPGSIVAYGTGKGIKLYVVKSHLNYGGGMLALGIYNENFFSTKLVVKEVTLANYAAAMVVNSEAARTQMALALKSYTSQTGKAPVAA
jgi:hypothetical protein